jgi:hypothetical protein
MDAAEQRAVQSVGATSHSRHLAAYFGSARSKWHWVLVALFAGIAVGFNLPWQRCPVGADTKGGDGFGYPYRGVN